MVVRKKRVETENSNGESRLPTEEKIQQKQIVIERVRPEMLDVEIEGLTPLLVCAWSFKARQQMLDKQMKKAVANKVREAKNPEEDYKNSRYVSTEGWDGIPASGLKGCLVNTCRVIDGLPMTLAKRILFVEGQGITKEGQGLIRIYGESEMHEGMVRNDNGSADIRFRAIYYEWRMKVQITYLANKISADQVCHLLETAGYAEGLCEHRPGAPKSNTGDMGRFRIKQSQ